MARYVDLDKVIELLEIEWGYEGMREELYALPAADVVEVVHCRDCVHAVEIEKDYVRKLFIDGTKQCEICRGDMCYGASIISAGGYCDSGKRRAD